MLDTLLMILKQQIQQLHDGVVQMDEQSLVKQLAKNKVKYSLPKIIYNLDKKSNSLQLVYSFIALAQYYISHQAYEPAYKTLTQAQQVRQAADLSYLIGVCLYKTGKKKDSYKYFDLCLKQQWIQPSQGARQTNQLEAINYIQKIQYQLIKKYPERRNEIQQKLIELCYDKIDIIKKYDSSRSQNYYYALAMADLSQIYQKFNQNKQAHQKIKTAIQMIKGENLSNQKLIQFYYTSALIAQKLDLNIQSLSELKNAVDLIQEAKKLDKHGKFSQLYQDIYYMYIKKTLGV